MIGIEAALVLAVRRLLPLLIVSPVLLAIPTDRLLAVVVAQMVAIVIAQAFLTDRLAGLAWPPWFDGRGSERMRRFGTIAAITALAVGFSALATLASSAALRLQPSLQFLQLLSTMDIAWVVTATWVAVGWVWGRRAGRIAGMALALVCVASQWRYLAIVGFTPDGRWLLVGRDLARLVLPFDTMAAIIALGTTFVAVRRPQGATAQPSPQS